MCFKCREYSLTCLSLNTLMELEQGRKRDHCPPLIRARNSSRAFGSSLNTPSMALVTVRLFIFCTPRMTIHMWLQQQTSIQATNNIWNTNFHAYYCRNNSSTMTATVRSIWMTVLFLIFKVTWSHWSVLRNMELWERRLGSNNLMKWLYFIFQILTLPRWQLPHRQAARPQRLPLLFALLGALGL